MLICDLVRIELIRLAPNEERARAVAERLGAFEAIPMPAALWDRARDVQLLLSSDGSHRRVPPADLMIAAAAETAGVSLVHYDRDYERIAQVSELDQIWLAPEGALA